MVRDEGVEPSESRIRSEWHTPCRIPVGRPPGYRARQARIWNPRCTLCAACKLVVRVSIELTASRVSTERSTFELPNRGVPGRTRTSTTTVGGSHAIRYITRTWRHAGDSNPSFPVDGRMHSLIASTALALFAPHGFGQRVHSPGCWRRRCSPLDYHRARHVRTVLDSHLAGTAGLEPAIGFPTLG